MLLDAFGSFSPRRQPWITRQSYAHELVTSMTFPVAVAMIEGGVISVLAAKAFDAPPLVFATLMAAPMFANITSFAWARLARGRRKVRSINVLQMLVLICVALIATLPATPEGSVLLAGLMIAARCGMAGIVTLRSTVWRMNYPRQVRGQATGKLALLASLIMAGAPLLGYAVLDRSPEAFRLLYPVAAVIALVGVAAFGRVRLRGERELLRYESATHARPQPHGAEGPVYEYDPRQPAGNENFWTVLRHDHTFRRYMVWQYVAGMSNMMGEAAVIYAIVQLTAGLRWEYVISILLGQAIPMALITLTLPLWAHHLDRVHIARFRMRQGWFWIGCQAGHWLGTAMGSLGVLLLPRTLQGVSRGGGMLAWNLGHNDFADRRLVPLYMGIHVTLTGIRGATAPFLGVLLYAGWDPVELSALGLRVPGFAGIGPWVFAITTALAVGATLGFAHLHRQLHAAGAAHASDG